MFDSSSCIRFSLWSLKQQLLVFSWFLWPRWPRRPSQKWFWVVINTWSSYERDSRPAVVHRSYLFNSISCPARSRPQGYIGVSHLAGVRPSALLHTLSLRREEQVWISVDCFLISVPIMPSPSQPRGRSRCRLGKMSVSQTHDTCQEYFSPKSKGKSENAFCTKESI